MGRKWRQLEVDGVPKDVERHFEIAVRKGIAQVVGEGQGKLGMCSGERRVGAPYVAARLTDDFKIANHSIMDDLAGKVVRFLHVCDIALDALNGFKDVPQVVSQPLGVNTSTRTPRICLNSMRMALMSKSVVSGVGSMRMSRSLFSVSRPWSTEPNTRALRAWWGCTAVLLYTSDAADGTRLVELGGRRYS